MLGRYFYFESNGSNVNQFNFYVEIQIVDNDGVNRALDRGLLRYSSVHSDSRDPSVVTDGNTNSNNYFATSGGVQHIVIDLGDVYDISYIKIWRYYSDTRIFNDVLVKVSEDDVEYTTVFSSVKNGLYPETSAGYQIDLPSGDEEPEEPSNNSYVEYLASNGSQYIDTGILAQSNLKIELQAELTATYNYQAFFGSHESGDKNRISWYHYIGNQLFYYYDSGTYPYVDKSDFWSKHTYVFDNNKVYIDGTEVTLSASIPEKTFVSTQTMYLFARYYDGNAADMAHMKLYYFKVWQNDELIADFAPAVDSDGVACVYDKVTDAYFYNSGTGEFVAGPIVEEPETPDEPEISVLMPVMTDVNAFFDARAGVTDSIWKNQTDNINFELFNPIKNADGVEVVGSDTSYGKFTKPYVSGSSRTWYFVFKNIGGVYADWKTIVGNESGTYTCSTIAMDKNANLAFTRNNILQSTYKCSDWHVVAWVSNASSLTTKLWIDGTYIGSATGMQGWADDTYLCRGSTWSYEDNNTAFKAIAIADSAHSDSDVVTNSKWLYKSYIMVEDESGNNVASSSLVYNFNGKIRQNNSWVDTINLKSLTIGKGSFVWEDNYLALSKNINYFNLSTDYGSYGTFEVLVKIDESFTPISTSNWYQASCIFGCELGGQQRDWGIIIDKNGYFAIGYGFSSIASTDVLANDGQWHTLAIIVSNSDMKLYIDGVLKNTVNITMSGTAISTYGVGWNKADSATSITGHIGTIKVWSDSLTEEEILKSYRNSVKWLRNIIEKYLFMSDSLVYTVTNGILTQITDSKLTSETFNNFGLDKLPESSIILGLANPKILYWTDAEDFHTTKVTMTATPNPQPIVTNSIDLSHPTIIGINSITGECAGSPLFSCEFNGAWKEHDGTAWVDSTSGMTYETLSVITPEQWDEMIVGLDSFKLKVILDSADDKVTKLNVNYNFDVTQAVAPNEEVISDV